MKSKIQLLLLALLSAFGFCSCAGDGSAVRFVPSGGYQRMAPRIYSTPYGMERNPAPRIDQPLFIAPPRRNNSGNYVRRQPAPNFYNGGGGAYGRRNSYYDENGARPDGYNPRYGGAIQSRIDPSRPFARPFYEPYQPMR